MSLLRRTPGGPILAALTVLGLWAMSNAPTAIDRVPALEGLAVDKAQTLAAEHGFPTRVVHRPGPGVAGTVVAQDPPPGTLLEGGSAIDIQVTKGARQVTVPQVAGLPVTEARRVLAKAGLIPGDVIYRRQPEAEPNRVITTEPSPGTSVDARSKVHVIAAA